MKKVKLNGKSFDIPEKGDPGYEEYMKAVDASSGAMDDLIVSIEDDKLVIKIKMEDKVAPSHSGKNLVIASTRGIRNTGVKVRGQELRLGVNAFIKK